jgi:phage gp29-like protein
MHLNLLSDQDKERLLFIAAGNGDVRAQEELNADIASL